MQQDVNKCFSELYKMVYEETSGTQESEIEEALEIIDLPKINAEEADGFKAPITKELEHAIRGLPSGKAPGADGLPSEFYKQLMAEVTPSVLVMLN